MRAVVQLVTLMVLTNFCHAQFRSGDMSYQVQVQNLFSTHRTNFPGIAAICSRPISNSVSIGLGAEFSYNNYHGDNGYDLTRMRFFPVFADLAWHPFSNQLFSPYFHTSHGVSLNSYLRKSQATGDASQVREFGYYAYGGFGTSWKIRQQRALSVELGLKGFKMSANVWDINPHGLTARIGYTL